MTFLRIHFKFGSEKKLKKKKYRNFKILLYFLKHFSLHLSISYRIVWLFSMAWMISLNSVLSINTMVSSICHIGQHPPVITWTVQMVPFSRHTSAKTPHCICMTKICAVCCRCHLKKKLLPETMCLDTDSHQPNVYLHQSKIIQITYASVQMDHHAHHMECSMYQLVNTVNIFNRRSNCLNC